MVKYYLCSGNRTGISDPDRWVFIDIIDGVDVMGIKRLDNADFVFATPPCNGFTDLPWRKATNEGQDILMHCLELCIDSGAPWILENSRFAQKFLGKANVHYSGHYFWGNATDRIIPFIHIKGKTSGKYPLKRAGFPGVIIGDA